jgi:tRNA 2-thiouridine synthesizing protein D
MIYTICIVNGPTSQAPMTALKFAQAVLQKKHTINKVFFYMDGVYNTSKFIIGSEYHKNISQEWKTLIKQNNLTAIACVSAALKRGIIDSEEAKINDFSDFNLDDNYEISGITQWISAIVEADRHIVFG